MAWFQNHYVCARCGENWLDEWSAMCEDDCPYCGARHMSPYKSDDWTTIVEQAGKSFVVLRSAEAAEYDPEYCRLGIFSTRAKAQAFMASRK
jgi:DNA-directed RNA polymerase subunit RPC12/RpoP